MNLKLFSVGITSIKLRPNSQKIPSIYGLGKAANPPDISVVGVYDFTKFRIPPPPSFELKTMSRIFPCPGAEKPIHPLVFPDIFPWLARGPTPGASR